MRGVLPGQKLDTQIKESSILSTKLKEFGPWGIKYEKASRDMQKLTAIENRHKAGLPLSREDLIFLYELDEPIASIEERDPRIIEIRAKRNTKDDLYHAFNGRYSKKEISVTSVEWETNQTKVHYGNLNYSAKDMQLGKKLPEILIGDLQLFSIESADGLKLPDTLIGTLNMLSVKSPHGMHLPKNLKGKLILGIETADGLEFPPVLYESLNLAKLTSARGLRLPQTIYGGLFMMNLTSPKDLVLPKGIYGHLIMPQLTTARGLKLPHDMNMKQYHGPQDF